MRRFVTTAAGAVLGGAVVYEVVQRMERARIEEEAMRTEAVHHQATHMAELATAVRELQDALVAATTGNNYSDDKSTREGWLHAAVDELSRQLASANKSLFTVEQKIEAHKKDNKVILCDVTDMQTAQVASADRDFHALDRKMETIINKLGAIEKSVEELQANLAKLSKYGTMVGTTVSAIDAKTEVIHRHTVAAAATAKKSSSFFSSSSSSAVAAVPKPTTAGAAVVTTKNKNK